MRVALAWAVLTVASAACACDCGFPTIPSQRHMSSDVFVGRVRSAGTLGLIRRGRVFVERSWKGTPAGRTVVVGTMRDGPTCGVEFKVGDRMLVFARPGTGDVQGMLWTDLCDRSTTNPLRVAALSDSLGEPSSTAKLPHGWWGW